MSGKLLKDHYPEIFLQIHPTLNKEIDFDTISVTCVILLYWLCPNNKCGHHIWKRSPRDMIRYKYSCAFCRGTKKCECESLSKLRPDLMKKWDWEKNEKLGLDPEKLTLGSNVRANWKCPKTKCDHHKWESTICNMDRYGGCPYCSGHKHCDCDSIFARYPELMEEWDWEKNNKLDLDPKKLYRGSHVEVHWKCNKKKCGHHLWSAPVYSRTSGTNCPFCANVRTCPCDSFMNANPELAEEYDHEKNKDIDPYVIAKHANKKLWWKCRKGHSWMASVLNRSYGRGCSICKESLLERQCRKILTALSDLYSITFESQKTFDECRNPETGLELRFDFSIKRPGKRLMLIELDGGQHFWEVSFDGKTYNLEKTRRKDGIKNCFCIENDIHFLRISFSEKANMEKHIKDFFKAADEADEKGEESVFMLKGVEYENE